MNVFTRHLYTPHFRARSSFLGIVHKTFCTTKTVCPVDEIPEQNKNDSDIFGNLELSPEKETPMEDISKEFLKHINRNSKEINKLRSTATSQRYNLSKNKKQFKETNSDVDQFGTLDPDLMKKMSIESLPQDDELVTKKIESLPHNKETFQQYQERHGEYFSQIIQKVKENRLKEALAIFSEMKQEGVRPQVYVFIMLIGACGRAGYHKMAFEIFTEMRKRGHTPNPATLTGLFNACAESPFPQSALIYARRLYDKIEIDKFPTNEIVYHSMVKAFGRCRDIMKAFQLVDEMVEKKMTITTDTFNHLLQTCISNREAGFTHAIMVLRQMMKWRIPLKKKTYNLLLRCSRDCGIGGEEVRAQLLINLIPPLSKKTGDSPQALLSIGGVPQASPTSFSFLDPRIPSQPQSSDLLVGLRDAETPQDRLILLGGAEGFLRHMASNKVRPSIKTLTLLLDCIPPTVEAETQLLTALKSGHLRPDVDFFNMLIKRRCLRHHYKEAKEVLDFLPKHGLTPNLMTYGVLAMACRSNKDFQTFLTDLKRLRIRPNIEMLGSVLKTGVHQLNFFLILEVMEAMRREEVRPDRLVLRLLDKALAEGERQFWLQEKQLPGARQSVVCSPSFKKGYTYFRMRYKSWLESVQMELPQHPWEQFRPDPSSSPAATDDAT